VSKVKRGMEVYFTTLGGGDRRWSSTVRQILPTPTVTNNVVLYTGLFDIDNADGALLPEMTTQVYFVSSSAENVLVVPMGAISFIDGAQPDLSRMGSVMAAGGAPGGPPGAGGERPEITPEMRERFQQMRESGNFPAGGFSGEAGPGQGFGMARLTRPGERSLAKVTVMRPDGTREEREVVIGLTSRVNAEVISGLKAGEEVVAGIVQGQVAAPSTSNNNNNFRPGLMRF